MKKVLVTEKYSQMNDRTIARAIEKEFKLDTGLLESEDYYEKNFYKLSNLEAINILDSQREIMNRILEMFNVVVISKGLKHYEAFAERK